MKKAERRAQKGLMALALCLLLGGCQNEEKMAVERWQRSSAGSVAAAITSGGGFSLVAGYDEPAGWWDNAKGARLFNWRLPGDAILLVAISPDGQVAATASNHHFATWDTATGRNLGYYTAPKSLDDSTKPGTLRGLALSNQGRVAALALADGRAVTVDLKTGRRMEFLGHQISARREGVPDGWAGVNAIDISPNGRYVLSGGDDHQAILWDAKTGQPLHTLSMSGRVNLVGMDAKHKKLFSASVKAEAYVWDAQTGEKVSRLALKPRDYVLSSVAFSSDGKRVITGAPGRDVWMWSVDSGKALDHWRVSAKGKRGAVVLATAFRGADTVITESTSGMGERWTVSSR